MEQASVLGETDQAAATRTAQARATDAEAILDEIRAALPPSNVPLAEQVRERVEALERILTSIRALVCSAKQTNDPPILVSRTALDALRRAAADAGDVADAQGETQ